MTHAEILNLLYDIIRVTSIVSLVLIWFIYSIRSLDFYFFRVYEIITSEPRPIEISPYIRAILLVLFFLLTAVFSFTVGWALHFYEYNK